MSSAIFIPQHTGAQTEVTPYISVQEFLDAPTSVDTSQLTPGGSTPANNVELFNVIGRASGWANSLCFQILAATLDTQMASNVLVHRNGKIYVPCNFYPVREVDTFQAGPTPSTMTA